MQLDKYLALLTSKQGSDLYLTVNLPPCLRINDQVLKTDDAPLSTEQIKQLIQSMTSDADYAMWQAQQECDFAYTSTTGGRYRVNVYQQRNLPALVIRPISDQIPSMEQLGLPPILQKLIQQKKGLILFVGSTGVGKSTSMASLIDYRNQTCSGHIITVEDPIEFIYQHKKSLISQREVGTDTESYATALKNILRERPDVIQIGEVRDRETMNNVLQCSETGHLVLSTLHANGASQAVERICSFYPADSQAKILLDLSLNLSAVVSQRMTKNLDGEKQVCFEIMLITPNIAELIKTNNITGIHEAMAQGNHLDMFTFDQDLFRLYQAGTISKDEALHNADSATDLEIRIKLIEGKDDTGDLKIK